MSERNELFDSWAERYDDDLRDTTGFPFEGYERVLSGVVGGAEVGAGAEVLDVGTGTGALAVRFAGLGCAVTGVDFSEQMLMQARQNVPGAEFRQLNLLGACCLVLGTDSSMNVSTRSSPLTCCTSSTWRQKLTCWAVWRRS